MGPLGPNHCFASSLKCTFGQVASFLQAPVPSHVRNNNSDLLIITFEESTSSEKTIDAVREIRNLTKDKALLGGMSSMVLDTMNLSEKEIAIYIVIAVILCILVLSISLDSYVVPFIQSVIITILLVCLNSVLSTGIATVPSA